MDKTFFIMNSGEVRTFYTATFTPEEGVQILVYDRDTTERTTVLDQAEVKYVLNEQSNHYNLILKEFLLFLNKDLADRPILRQFISELWNEDYEAANETLLDNPTVGEDFVDYMQVLIINKSFDESVLRYFNAVYCEQEMYLPKCNNAWLRGELLFAGK
jgi:hypothetical protein